MQEAVRRSEMSLTRKYKPIVHIESCSTNYRMTLYLSKTNVQLGASYHTGSVSNTKYEEGYRAAASYVNAGRDEIGML